MPLSPQRCEELAAEIEKLDEDYITLLEEVEEEEQEQIDKFEEDRADAEEDGDLESRLAELDALMMRRNSIQEDLQSARGRLELVIQEKEMLETIYQDLEEDKIDACEAVDEVEDDLDTLNDDIERLDNVHREIMQDLQWVSDPQERMVLEQEKKNVEEMRNAFAARYRWLLDEVLPEARYDCEMASSRLEEIDLDINEYEYREAEIGSEIELLDLSLSEVDNDIADLVDIIDMLKRAIEWIVNWFADQSIALKEKKMQLDETEDLLFQKNAEYESHCSIYE